jgi:hypothetical protein
LIFLAPSFFKEGEGGGYKKSPEVNFFRALRVINLKWVVINTNKNAPHFCEAFKFL